jgi:hypothetical protein
MFMKAIVFLVCLSIQVFASQNLDFNKEINQISQEQFDEHLKTVSQTKVTEAALDFENAYRKPQMDGKLTDLTIRIKPK